MFKKEKLKKVVECYNGFAFVSKRTFCSPLKNDHLKVKMRQSFLLTLQEDFVESHNRFM